MTMQTADEAFDALYSVYGSDTGYLFGIEPKHKTAVKAIVKYIYTWTIEELERNQE